MIQLAATLHVLGLQVADRARTNLTNDRERGGLTIEHVMWAAGVIVIVGIVALAIRTYVTNQAAQIQ